MLKHTLQTFCFLLCFLALAPLAARAAQVNLAWNASTSTVAGYKILYGTAAGAYTKAYDAGNATSCTISGLADNADYHFVAVAYDASGNQSEYSNDLAYRASGQSGPELTMSTAQVESEDKIAFTAQLPSGITGVSSYTWSYNGDGAIDETTSAPSATHSFATAGQYNVVCTAVDANGNALASATIPTKITAGALEAAPTQADPSAPASITDASYTQMTAAELVANYKVGGTVYPMRTIIDFTANAGKASGIGTFRFSIYDIPDSVANMKLIKLKDNGTNVEYTYSQTASPQTSGSWWITDANGGHVDSSATLQPNTRYYVNFAVADGSAYDLDPAAGLIRDPVSLATTNPAAAASASDSTGSSTSSTSSGSTSSGGGGSGGCVYAPSASLGLELLLPLLVALALRLRRRND